ncbi:dipeptide ABC transporter ATP-binding protein [Gordonia sp. NPDC003376]
MTTPLLRIDGLSVRFEGRTRRVTAVGDLSLELRRGEALALVGESGSGKSVTASAIAGLLPKAADVDGSIVFDGHEMVGASERRLRTLRGARIGTVFQNPATSFDPSFTIGNQLVELIRLHRRLSRPDAREVAVEWLRRVGISDPDRVLRSFPHQLSGGMRQRIMIAVACIPHPDLLIADEPTTALDPTLSVQILDLLDELRSELGITVLIVTHDFGVVARVSDSVAVLRGGELVETGPTRTVLTDPGHPYTRRLIAAAPVLRAAPAAASSSPGPDDPVLVAESLTRTFAATRDTGTFAAVDDVSVTVRRHRTLGLIGESGSGKSTLARLIAGIEHPTSGRVTLVGATGVPGVDVDTLSRHDRARRIQLVFQDHGSALNPRRRIGAQIARPIRQVVPGTTRAESIARARRLLEQVGLDPDFADRYPHQLSGGQRQRVGLARALGVRPEVIILDEPTSALDVTTQAEILELLARVREETGVTFVLISHDLAVVHDFADDIIVLDHGRIVDRFEAIDLTGRERSPFTRRLVDAVLPVTTDPLPIPSGS